MKNNSSYFLGIDIGGSAIKAGWGNSSQGLADFRRFPIPNNSLSALKITIEEILLWIGDRIGLDKLQAIGIGTPGTLNLKTGKIVGINPNLPEWTDLKPESIIPQSLRIPIFADNDANLMALAEAKHLPDKKMVVGITLGSGIGCGFVQDGSIYHGANGYAMELGHTNAIPEGVLCNCGRKGCLEAYTSVLGLQKLIKIKYPTIKINDMSDILRWTKTDSVIKKLVERSIRLLATSIANLIILLDADAVVLGGGVIELETYPTEKLITLILEHLPRINKDTLSITKAYWGNKAGTFGAIILAEQGFLQNREYFLHCNK